MIEESRGRGCSSSLSLNIGLLIKGEMGHGVLEGLGQQVGASPKKLWSDIPGEHTFPFHRRVAPSSTVA